MHDELRAVDKNLHDYETELVHDDIGPRRRKKLLEEFKILTEQRRYILDEIVQQEALLEDSRQNLREIMAQKPYYCPWHHTKNIEEEIMSKKQAAVC